MNVCSFFVVFFVFEKVYSATTRPCPPIRIQFGRAKYRQRGKIARFLCSPGYTLAGDRYSVCVQGKWDIILPKCVRPTCPQANPPANGLIYPSHGGGVLNFYCKSNYDLQGSSITYCNGTHWDNPLPTCLPANTKASLSCDFEAEDLCGWNHDLNHDFDWKRLNFATPSGSVGTGPSHDHTKGSEKNGYYMYIESSARNPRDTARLLSPIYDKSTPNENICFEFFYHMYGKTTGDLRVYLKKYNASWDLDPKFAVFMKSGNQGNRWFRGFLKLGNVNDDFQIIIEGVRGPSYVSDIAIDDVKIIRNCTSDDEVEEISTTEEPSFTVTKMDVMNVESCENRCDTIDLQSFANLITCDCNVECYDNNRCCPDYFDFCIAGTTDDFLAEFTTDSVTDKMTKKATTELITSTTTSSTTTTMATSTTTAIPTTTSSTTTSSRTTTRTTKAPSPTTSEESVTIYKKPNDSSDIVDVPMLSSDESDIPDVPSKETELINDYNGDKIASHQKVIVTPKVTESNTKSVIFGVGVVFGVLFAVTGMAFAARRYQLFQCKKLRRFNQSSNGDSQSDVRFLTSEECLDLNLPRDYDTL